LWFAAFFASSVSFALVTLSAPISARTLASASDSDLALPIEVVTRLSALFHFFNAARAPDWHFFAAAAVVAAAFLLFLGAAFPS